MPPPDLFMKLCLACSTSSSSSSSSSSSLYIITRRGPLRVLNSPTRSLHRSSLSSLSIISLSLDLSLSLNTSLFSIVYLFSLSLCRSVALSLCLSLCISVSCSLSLSASLSPSHTLSLLLSLLLSLSLSIWPLSISHYHKFQKVVIITSTESKSKACLRACVSTVLRLLTFIIMTTYFFISNECPCIQLISMRLKTTFIMG